MVFQKSIKGTELNIKVSEVFSFLNIPYDRRSELESTVYECIDEMSAVISPKLCYRIYPFTQNGMSLSLGFTETNSLSLSKCLDMCSNIILLAATIGIGADRLISRYMQTRPSKGVIMQAVGSAAIECWLDHACEELREELKDAYTLRPRFSCGYGDLSLSMQTAIFAALQPEKSIGLTLNESLLMTPQKSVTAIIGLCPT